MRASDARADAGGWSAAEKRLSEHTGAKWIDERGDGIEGGSF